jgi:hypothetical protein
MKCWNMFCIATDCGSDSTEHVDATGYTWQESREDRERITDDDGNEIARYV